MTIDKYDFTFSFIHLSQTIEQLTEAFKKAGFSTTELSKQSKMMSIKLKSRNVIPEKYKNNIYAGNRKK